jgi:UDP-3-O-[3-hydroxymyristoyl] glucosamine N-acyltransferase
VVQIGERNTVIANIYAPNGTVFLRANTIGTRAFIGKRAEIGERVELTLKSAF